MSEFESGVMVAIQAQQLAAAGMVGLGASVTPEPVWYLLLSVRGDLATWWEYGCLCQTKGRLADLHETERQLSASAETPLALSLLAGLRGLIRGARAASRSRPDPLRGMPRVLHS